MSFNPGNFEMMFGGSHVGFKKRERPPLSEQEREFKLENDRKLQEGISVLRKLRTRALEEQDSVVRQNILKEAHQFSNQMAEVIISQALNDKPSTINSSFLDILQQAQNEHIDQDAGSGHATPPQFSVSNLFRAIDDMLVRIEEKAQSIVVPNHKLTKEEMRYVLQEFLRGTNDLTINAIEKFFEKDTKVGGILSGGSVYVEMVKKVVERYGDSSLIVNSFVIAVDKQNKKAVFEASESDVVTRAVIVTDDMIDEGDTLLTALWATGEQFPNAIIYSGKGTDQPGGFEKRRTEKHMEHLGRLFEDFADLSVDGQNDKALILFGQAEQYARENKVTLQPAWYTKKERIEKSKKKEGN